MCSIGGYVGMGRIAGDAVLRRMSGTQWHREPSGAGFFQDIGFGLTHHRLTVLGHQREQQPMRSTDGRFVLSFRGDVYNCHQVRGDLAPLGHEFDTLSDTEVVLAAWAQWQEKALTRFDGAFALAVADTLTGAVTLTRDPSGAHPLFLADLGDGRVLFASEIRAILATGLISRRTGEPPMRRYLRFRFQRDGELTSYPGIRRVLPGQVVVISDGTLTFRDCNTQDASGCHARVRSRST
jgi:asparagine synthase (glutamine-hydrolysing)